MDNQTIADRLREHARELDSERGNLFRVRAYRLAAQEILEQDQNLAAVLAQGGRRALASIPAIGPHIAKAIESLIRNGEFSSQPALPAARLSSQRRGGRLERV